MITKAFLIKGICLALLSGHAAAQGIANVDVNLLGTPMTGLDGVTPLDAGSAANGDGAVVQIGYFDGVGTGSDPAFWGVSEWASFTPLTGNGSPNEGSFPTSVGDADSGASGGFGLFSFGAAFEVGVDSGLPAGYPARLGVRVYDGTTVAGSTAYNTVTSFFNGGGSDWGWLLNTPVFPPGPLDRANLDLDSSPLVWESGAAGAFQTSMAMTPEPSSALLVFLGCFLLGFRRR